MNVEKLSRRRLSELENRRLRKVVRVAYEKTRLYRRKFKEARIEPDDVKSYDDLVKLPFSSKEDFTGRFMDAVASKVSVWHTTSGTSGTPTVVGFSEGDVKVQVSIEARNLATAGFVENDVVYNTTPYGMFFAGICLHEGARSIGAAVIPAGKQPSAKRHVELIKAFKPTAIVGIPQYILKLAHVYEDAFGVDPRRSTLKKAYVLGEPLPASMRQRLEDAWGIEVRAGYGLTEAGSGAECEFKEGVHWPEDHTLVEVVDPETGERVGEGEEGELVYTTLTRTGTLSIRFKSSDHSKVVAEGCGCGRTLLRVMPPKFRLDGMAKIRGTLTSPYTLDSIMYEYPEVRNYLCVVEKDDRGVSDLMRLYVEADLEDPGTVKKIREEVNGRISVTPDLIKYVPPDSIPSFGRKETRFIDLRRENLPADTRELTLKFLNQFR